MKVFISYAREDWEIAERVWSDLKRAGIDAWTDRKELLPGQNWKTEIRKAIRTSSHFIALLSTRSVSKQGFFQTELKKAIDVLDTFPEHRIYFIPVRIDNCEPGYERLGDIHWADLFPSYEEGLSQILRVLVPEKSAPQIRKPKYQLRKEPMTVSEEMFKKFFKLDEKKRPLEYIKNEYRNNNDGIITDYATGLIWEKSGSNDNMSYRQAQAYILGLNQMKFAGHNDWRLPTVDELTSLLEPDEQSKDLYINPIFDDKQQWCWTSEQRVPDGAWYISFVNGYVSWRNLLSSNLYVRAVRSIQ
jgi:hypothetical protein